MVAKALSLEHKNLNAVLLALVHIATSKGRVNYFNYGTIDQM